MPVATADDERAARLALSLATAEPAAGRLEEGHSAAEHIPSAMREAAHRAARHVLDQAERKQARYLIPTDEEWPSTLHLGPDTPLGVWVRGTASLADLTRKAVALTGSHAASDYGTHTTSILAEELADGGYTITAAIGQGISAAALNGARICRHTPAPIGLHADGIAAISRPKTCRAQEQRILDAGGLIVSLCAPGTILTRTRAFQRQRLLGQLTPGVVLIEAALGARSLKALRHYPPARPLMALPGPVTSALSAGPNELIRDHFAQAVTSAEDIRAVLTPR